MLRDLTIACRIVRNQPRFAVSIVLLLAVGIGPTVAIFGVIHAVLVRPLPFDKPDQLVYVWESAPRMGLARSIVSPPNFADWRRRSSAFEHLAAFRTWFYTVQGRDEPEQVWGVRVSGNFFELLRVQPARGQGFRAQDDAPGRDAVVTISDALWRRRFSADPALIGKPIVIDGRPYTVVGILPPSFDLFGTSREFDLWMPFDYTRGAQARDNYSLLVFGRLRAGVGIDRAQAEMDTIATALEREYPATNAERGAAVVGIREHATQPLRPALLMLMAAVGFVLVIACANAANLLLARAIGRRTEFAVRGALGATRWQLARQAIAEALVLSASGGIAGLVLAAWTLALVKSWLPAGTSEIPHAASATLDLPLIAFAAALSLIVAMIIAAGGSIRHPSNECLVPTGSARTSGDRRTGRTRRALLTAQVAVALILLLSAGLTFRSLDRLVNVPPGFAPDHLLTMQLWLPEGRYSDGTRVHQLLNDVVDRTRGLPGVQATGGVNFLPFSGWGDLVGIRGTDAPAAGNERTPASHYADYRVVVGEYFGAAGIPIRRGRALARSDTEDAEPVAVVNEAFARQHWPARDPIGRSIELVLPATHAPWRPIVRHRFVRVAGVAADIRERGFAEAATPLIYLAASQFPSRLMRLTVRTSGEPILLSRAIERTVRSADSSLAVTEIKTMTRFMDESVAPRRLSVVVFAALAAVAFIVAVGGVWSAVSYATAQRTREIGIRKTLGATDRAVLVLIVRQAMVPVLIGGVIGTAGALGAASLLQGLLFGISAADPVTYGVVGIVFLAVSAVACWLPARRATRMDPSAALRVE